MPVDTFWTSQGQIPGVPLLQPTPGDLQPNPLTQLRGLNPDGSRDPGLALADQTIFPRYDGTTTLLPGRPADFANPTPASFANWHAAHQVEWLREYGTTTTVTDGPDTFTVISATLGTNPQPFMNLHVVLSANGLRPIVLNSLSATDLAALPLADQRAIASTAIFRNEFAVPQALIPDPDLPSVHDARAQMQALVQERIDVIEAAPTYDPGREADFLADPNLRATLYHYLYTAQLKMLQQRLNDMAVFHPDTIKAEADALLTRFSRLERYMGLTAEGTAPGSSLPTGVNATDGGDSIRAAQNVLKGIELRLFDLASAARIVATTGTYEGRRVDTPDMVFLFQTFQNYTNEAEAEAKSEELKQLQRLLEDYTGFQRLLNTTLQVFDPVAQADPDTVEKKPLNGYSTLNTTNFTANEIRLVAMFDSYLSAAVANNSYHPVETDRALDRPVEAILGTGTNLISYAKPVWDAFARNLAEATKVLNQDSQIRMDEVSRLNRQKNRNYDLATNTLNKMADILRSIIN